VDLSLELMLALSSMVLDLQSKHIGIEGQNGMDLVDRTVGLWDFGKTHRRLAMKIKSYF